MAEMTREKWTPAAYEIVKHIEALQEIAKDLEIDGLSVGITTNPEYHSFAFCVIGEDEDAKTFEVNVGRNNTIFREGSVDYQTYNHT